MPPITGATAAAAVSAGTPIAAAAAVRPSGRISKPVFRRSRRRGGEVADLLMAVLRGAVAEAGKADVSAHVAGRLHLCLRLVYAGRPSEDDGALSAAPAARDG